MEKSHGTPDLGLWYRLWESRRRSNVRLSLGFYTKFVTKLREVETPATSAAVQAIIEEAAARAAAEAAARAAARAAAEAAVRAAAEAKAKAEAEAEARQKLPEEIAKLIKKLEEEVEQERLKNKAKGKRRQANHKKQLGENAKEEEAEASGEKMLEQHHGNPGGVYCNYCRSGDSTSDQSSSEILGTAPRKNFDLLFNQGEISEEARRMKISKDTVTQIPRMPNEGIDSIEAQRASPTSNQDQKRIEMHGEYDTLTIVQMPNDSACTTNSSFASSHNSSDVLNCNHIKAEDKTAVLHLNQRQSSFGSEVRIYIPDADSSPASTTMLDGPSHKTRFPHDINNIIHENSTLMPDGPSQQTRFANDNNNTIVEDAMVMPDGPSQEMGELEMTLNRLEERTNMSGDDDDDDDDSSSTSGNDDDDDSSSSSREPRETWFPNGVNNAILGFTGQAVATIVAANSPSSLAVHLFAWATGIGFYGSLFAALFLKRHPNIAKILFKIGVSASAFTVMIALGGYLPTQWYLNMIVPAVACVIIAVMVALSKLD